MISTTNSKHVYNGDGVTIHWPYTYPINATTDIKVYLTVTATGVQTLLSSGYTVDTANSWVLYPNTGSPLAAGTTITLLRTVPLTQDTDWKNQGDFDAEVLESSLDKLTMETQQ